MAHRGGSDSTDLEVVRGQAIGRSISWREAEAPIDSGGSPGAAAPARRVFCHQFGRLERGRHGPGGGTTDPSAPTDWSCQNRYFRCNRERFDLYHPTRTLNRSTKQFMKTR